VRLRWYARGGGDGAMLDAATPYWGIAFSRLADGRALGTIIGPSVEPRHLDWAAGDAYWGVELEAHVVWRGLDKGPLLGRLVDLDASDGWCTVAGVRTRVPEPDELEEFVARLAQQGVLVGDPDVAAALAGEDPHWSGRTMQRRFRAVTGLGRKQVQQVERARHAFALLQQGMRPADVAVAAGYADQPHLTRSLALLAGQTPAQILAGRRS
jgi:hypothetical protein